MLCGMEYYTQGLRYELNEDGESYSVGLYLSDRVGAEIYFPTVYNGLPVTEIKKSGFWYNNSITYVKISNSIKKLTILLLVCVKSSKESIYRIA